MSHYVHERAVWPDRLTGLDANIRKPCDSLSTMHRNCLKMQSRCVPGHYSARLPTFPHNQRWCPCSTATNKFSKPQPVVSSKRFVRHTNRLSFVYSCPTPGRHDQPYCCSVGVCAAGPARLEPDSAAVQAEYEQVLMSVWTGYSSIQSVVKACGFCSCGSSSSLTLMHPFRVPLRSSYAQKTLNKQQQSLKKSLILPKCMLTSILNHLVKCLVHQLLPCDTQESGYS